MAACSHLDLIQEFLLPEHWRRSGTGRRLIRAWGAAPWLGGNLWFWFRRSVRGNTNQCRFPAGVRPKHGLAVIGERPPSRGNSEAFGLLIAELPGV